MINRPVHAGAVEPGIAGEGHVGDHVEGGRDHFVQQVHRAGPGSGDTVTAAVGRRGHDGGERHHVAMRKDWCRRAPLPPPVRPFCDKERLAYGGPQQVFRDVGFRIIFDVFKQDATDRLRAGNHVPRCAGMTRDNRLSGRCLWDDRQQVVPRRLPALQRVQRSCRQSGTDGQGDVACFGSVRCYHVGTGSVRSRTCQRGGVARWAGLG